MSLLATRELGQNVTPNDVVTSVCRVAEITGKSQVSYCNEADKLKVERNQTDARAPASVIVPPCGMNPLLTFSCRKFSCRVSLGVNQ